MDSDSYYFVKCPYCHAIEKTYCGTVCFKYTECPKCGRKFTFDHNLGETAARRADWHIYGFFIVIFMVPIGAFIGMLGHIIEGFSEIVLVINATLIVLGFFYLLGGGGRKHCPKAFEVLADKIRRTYACINGVPCKNEDKQKGLK